MSKREQIRRLLQEGKLNRAEIAREVGASYQVVRNVEAMVYTDWERIIPPDSDKPTEVSEYSILEIRTEIMLFEDRPPKFEQD